VKLWNEVEDLHQTKCLETIWFNPEEEDTIISLQSLDIEEQCYELLDWSREIRPNTELDPEDEGQESMKPSSQVAKFVMNACAIASA
jgi:hypothetical protein